MSECRTCGRDIGRTADGECPCGDILSEIEREYDARSYEMASVLSAAAYVPEQPKRSWWKRQRRLLLGRWRWKRLFR